eukprot:TRINITY_DN7673_c0_g1_i1.p1 TRINITY_DN7673_c0_g1~~TRINITY_DN7673_c0_g1_i1.p1  ORF type:complete len:153 (-),score=19.24 TRINITY_DN7673_c0_g1_i1:38-457(-)
MENNMEAHESASRLGRAVASVGTVPYDPINAAKTKQYAKRSKKQGRDPFYYLFEERASTSSSSEDEPKDFYYIHLRGCTKNLKGLSKSLMGWNCEDASSSYTLFQSDTAISLETAKATLQKVREIYSDRKISLSVEISI